MLLPSTASAPKLQRIGAPMDQKYNIKRRPRRTRDALKSSREKALRSLGDGLYPAHIARLLNESPRLVQKWARQWVLEGLLVESRFFPKGACRNYSLSEKGRIQHFGNRVATDPPQILGALKKQNRDGETASKKSAPKRIRGPGATPPHPPLPDSHLHSALAQGVGQQVCDDGGVFVGGHYWFFNARVHRPGRDLLDLLPEAKALRGLKRVRYGHVEVPGVGKVLLERFRPGRGMSGARRRLQGSPHGSLNVRFDMRALLGETPAEYVARGHRVARELVLKLALERGMACSEPLERSKRHLARRNDPDANDAARGRIRVTTRDPYGEVRMDASHGPEWETDAARSMAARGRMAGNVEWMTDQVTKVRQDLQALWETQANLEKLLESHTDALVSMGGLQRASAETTKSLSDNITALVNAVQDQTVALQKVSQILEAASRKPAPQAPPQPPDPGMWG